MTLRQYPQIGIEDDTTAIKAVTDVLPAIVSKTYAALCSCSLGLK